MERLSTRMVQNRHFRILVMAFAVVSTKLLLVEFCSNKLCCYNDAIFKWIYAMRVSSNQKIPTLVKAMYTPVENFGFTP